MENVEREINMKNSNLNLKLASYTPEDVDEFDVGEKIYLKKFKEIDKIHGELANLINGFIIEFPKAEKNQFYGDVLLESLSTVSYFKRHISAKVIQVKKDKNSSTTPPIIISKPIESHMEP